MWSSKFSLVILDLDNTDFGNDTQNYIQTATWYIQLARATIALIGSMLKLTGVVFCFLKKKKYLSKDMNSFCGNNCVSLSPTEELVRTLINQPRGKLSSILTVSILTAPISSEWHSHLLHLLNCRFVLPFPLGIPMFPYEKRILQADQSSCSSSGFLQRPEHECSSLRHRADRKGQRDSKARDPWAVLAVQH
jgi:hypothetical protein